MTLGVPHHDTQQTRGGDVLHTSGEGAASQGALPHVARSPGPGHPAASPSTYSAATSRASASASPSWAEQPWPQHLGTENTG